MQYLFKLLNVDYYQFRILLITCLKLDFRSNKIKSGAQNLYKNPILYIAVLINLFISSIIALFALKLSFFGFSLLNITAAMLLISIRVITGYNEIIINPEDFEIFSSRPLNSSTYFCVKMANLFFYITIFGLIYNLPPSFIGLRLTETTLAFPLTYFVVSWISLITITSFIIILYSLVIRSVNITKLKNILVYVQFVFILIFLFVSQILFLGLLLYFLHCRRSSSHARRTARHHSHIKLLTVRTNSPFFQSQGKNITHDAL